MRTSYVWVPMFPKPVEWFALPRTASEYADKPVTQYWDDSGGVGVEFKQRIIPDFDGHAARDAFILFDSEATWESAGEHVLGWGHTVLSTQDKLFALLQELR